MGSYDEVRHTYLSNKLFVSTGVSGSVGYDLSKFIPVNDPKSSERKSTHFSFDGDFTFGGGIGRIERVEDARQAYLLFHQLKKENRIQKEFSKEDVYDLARKISRLKSQRFFDSRLRRMYEIEAVDSFFVKNGFAEKTDARYFVTMRDLWLYGALQERKSGGRFGISFSPGYKYSHSKDEGIQTNNTQHVNQDFDRNHYFVFAEARFDYHKPIDIKWQTDLNFKVGTTLYDDEKRAIESEDINDEKKYEHLSLSSSLHHSLSYYPSTRTSCSVFYNVQYYENDYSNSIDTNDESFEEDKDFIFSIGSQAYYYLSPQLRLSANIGYDFRDNTDYHKFEVAQRKTDENFNNNSHFSYSIGLRYSLF